VRTEAVRATYAPKGAFHRELVERVDAYFADSGRSRHDDPRMYIKAAVVLTWLIGTFIALVWFVHGTLPAIGLAVFAGFAAAAVPMNLSHDAAHQAFSASRRVNAVMAHTSALLGINGPWWRYKHNVLHHGFTNIDGIDDDLDMHKLSRLTIGQAWLPHHRYQAWYLPALYPLLQLSLMFVADFSFMRTGTVSGRSLGRPSQRTIAFVLSEKALTLAWIIGIPVLAGRSLPAVLGLALVASLTMGTTLGFVFQVEHCLAEVVRPEPDASGHLGHDWASCQVEGAANVARSSRLFTWYSGALNHHIEHHLFPRVCHAHYPALAPIVQEVAERHGLVYRDIPTFHRAVRLHLRWLSQLAVEPAALPGFGGNSSRIPTAIASKSR